MVRNLKGKHPNYYEAILQLRDISQEVLDFMDTSNIVIQKIVKVKKGYDYFLADNDQARATGKALQSRFGGQITSTSSLHTKKDNKELYRVTILFRQSGFKRNDIVDYQGETYVVKAMAKDIFLQHQKTGKKVHVKYKDMKKITKVSSND